MPAEFHHLFEGRHALLKTHRGWDPGALTLAQEMAAAFDAPLFFTETTRLLIDVNRSLRTPDLHSEITKALPIAERREIARRYWQPHRERVEGWVRRAAWRPRAVEVLSGVLEKYAKLVGPAHLGAVTHAGAVEWPFETAQALERAPRP